MCNQCHHSATFPTSPHWRKFYAPVLVVEESAGAKALLPRRDGCTDRRRWSIKSWQTAASRIGGLLATESISDQVDASGALAENEAPFRATFENAAVGMSHVAPDGRWLRVNNALCRILGYSAEELLTRSFQDLTHLDDLAADLADVRQLLGGIVGSCETDKRFLHRNGTIIWVHRTVSCVRKSDGSVDYLVSVVEDISARRRAEERVHLLIREANHRVKNMLGLVQVIARQTVAGNPEDFIGRFTQRIQALATNQDLLSRNLWQGDDLEGLVRGQLAHFADFLGSRIMMYGSRLRLNAAAAQAIGLALHELATNAAKYGSLSTGAGRVDIGWQSEGDVFAMRWTERDGPPVRPPTHRGFGSTVIDSMVKRVFDAEVQVQYASPGLEWQLTCPAANALEPTADH
jgi:PAS domain S-box-containing protein